jgi:hypothetical protein
VELATLALVAALVALEPAMPADTPTRAAQRDTPSQGLAAADMPSPAVEAVASTAVAASAVVDTVVVADTVNPT